MLTREEVAIIIFNKCREFSIEEVAMFEDWPESAVETKSMYLEIADDVLEHLGIDSDEILPENPEELIRALRGLADYAEKGIKNGVI